MKNWILKLSFVQKVIAEKVQEYQFENLGTIKRLEQFKLHEVEELAQKKFQELLGNVHYPSVISSDKRTGTIYIGGVKAEETRLINLRSEAEFLLASDLYKVLSETKKDLAYKTMFERSESFDDMRQGKMMLYDISMDRNVINILKSYQPVARK